MGNLVLSPGMFQRPVLLVGARPAKLPAPARDRNKELYTFNWGSSPGRFADRKREEKKGTQSCYRLEKKMQEELRLSNPVKVLESELS